MTQDLFINGNIDNMMLEQMASILGSKDFLEYAGIDSFMLKINSNGGSVSAGKAMINLLKESGYPVDGIIVGNCKSMAFIMAEASCRTLKMYDNANIMSHRISVSGEIDGQNPDEIRNMADQFAKDEDWAIGVVASRTNSDPNYIRNSFFNGTDKYLTAKEALRERMIDQILSSKIEGIGQMNGKELSGQMSEGKIKPKNESKIESLASVNLKLKAYMLDKNQKIEGSPIDTNAKPNVIATAKVTEFETKPSMNFEVSNLQNQIKSLLADKDIYGADIEKQKNLVTTLMKEKAELQSSFESRLSESSNGYEKLKTQIPVAEQKVKSLESQMKLDKENFELKLGLNGILDGGKSKLTEEKITFILSQMRAQTSISEKENGRFEVKGLSGEMYGDGSLINAAKDFAFKNKHVESAPVGVVVTENFETIQSQMKLAEKERDHEKTRASLNESYFGEWDTRMRIMKGLNFSKSQADAFSLKY